MTHGNSSGMNTQQGRLNFEIKTALMRAEKEKFPHKDWQLEIVNSSGIPVHTSEVKRKGPGEFEWNQNYRLTEFENGMYQIRVVCDSHQIEVPLNWQPEPEPEAEAAGAGR
jgi:hypothetical protein